MLLNNVRLNEEEIKIRKYWLFAAIITFWVWPVLTLFNNHLQGGLSSEIFAKTSIQLLLGSTIWYSAFYHCAYKNQGTKLLTFTLITSIPLQILGLGILIQSSFASTSLVECAFSMAIFSFWYYLSLKLRAINKRVIGNKLQK